MRLRLRHPVQRPISRAIGRRLAVVGAAATVLVGVVGTAAAVAPPAGATATNGCPIVANPTPATHTICPGRNLSRANLSGLNMAYANLSGSNLSSANLSGDNLTGANLSGANLSGANLSNDDLTQAIVRGSNLAGANLSNISAVGANLSGSNLAGARLGEANLRSANVGGANLASLFCATVMPDGSINSSSCSIAVSPPTATVVNGLTQTFAAAGRYRDGTTMALTANVTWSSSNTNVATVSPTGVAKGVVPDATHSATFPQTATIKATAGTASGTATLTVLAPNLVSLAVSPPAAAVVVGGTQAFTAKGTYADNGTQDLTSSASWSSSKAQVATVSPTGVGTGVEPGGTTIHATSGAISGTATLNVLGALGITTSSLPGAVQGAPYSQSLAATGGTPAYTWSISAGNLPAGLSLNASTGAITGTPSGAGTSNFTVKVADPGAPAQSATQALSITVVTPLVIGTTSLPDAVQSVAGYSQRLSATGGTGSDTWSLAPGSGLPAGLSLGPDGTVSGTPTQTGNFTFTVQATDHSVPPQVVTKAVSINVVAPLAVTTASLPPGLAGSEYTQHVTASGGAQPYSWSLAPGSSLPAGLNLGGDGTLAGTLPATAGTVTFTAQVTDNGSPAQVATKALTIGVVSPLVVVHSVLPAVVAGSAYSQTLATPEGGTSPYTWSVTAGTLPQGLSLDSASGVISGRPTAEGTSNFTVTVTDSSSPAQSGSEDLSITVAPLLIVNKTILNSGVATVAYSSQTLTPAGGTPPFTWSVSQGSLAAGLTLDSSTGVISGTPTTAGTYNFSVRITDSGAPTGVPQMDTESFSIRVGPALSIATASLPDGITGASYNQTLVAGGGSPPYHLWATFDGGLPPGLTLDSSTGVISGTPTTPGSYSFTASVGDNAGQEATQSLSIVVVNPLSITTTSLRPAVTNESYSQTLGAMGGFIAPPLAVYRWFLLSGSLPEGLILNAATGVISGIPTTVGSSTFTVEVLDSVGDSAQQQLSVDVVAPPALDITCPACTGYVDGAVAPVWDTSAGYDLFLSASGGTPPYTWSAPVIYIPPRGSLGGLPKGLVLCPQTEPTNPSLGIRGCTGGEIYSDPSAGQPLNGNYSALIQVADQSGATSSIVLAIQVTNGTTGALNITTPGYTYSSGSTVATQVTAAGGTPPYTFQIVDGGLPLGVFMDSSGTLSGVVLFPGIYNFTVKVTDFAGASATATIPFTVASSDGSTTGLNCIIGCF